MTRAGNFREIFPIASKMLECALAQGYGPAADKLSYIYRRTHQNRNLGRFIFSARRFKLGCADCADNLSTEFNGFGLTKEKTWLVALGLRHVPNDTARLETS